MSTEHTCHDMNPPFPGPCIACEQERVAAARIDQWMRELPRFSVSGGRRGTMLQTDWGEFVGYEHVRELLSRLVDQLAQQHQAAALASPAAPRDVAANVEHWMAELAAEINRTPYRNPQQFAAVVERAARNVLTRVLRRDAQPLTQGDADGR